MTLAKYEIFRKTAETKSLTRAAEKLHLTQSAVSHAMNALEAELGFSLVNRARSGLTLTENGARMLEYIKEMLYLNEKMFQEANAIRGLDIGTVRIGTFTSVSSYWLPDIFKTFNTKYPGITIEVYEGDYEEIEDWLLQGKIDCGFVSQVRAEDLNQTMLKREKLLCIVPADHEYADQESISFTQLEQAPFIMPRYGSRRYEGYHDVKQYFKNHRIKADVTFELLDDYAIISMVRHGMGISILPEMLLHNLPPEVKSLDLEQDCHRTISIGSTQEPSPAARKFKDFVTSWIHTGNSRAE
ncbi:LysR family transcriptional regulator [Salibacterium halotolerans]|uniref:DNA-binding transcriptional regulator, LysR family n=1 Tax=Salibacterium halotolerans TaxID=1884432 RepID=A0A1I5PC10_9BACI|nr:LysR family transcriptional regulator [Salibacterium halotolerans]SFP31664.1 DNA-binding transcriptional regulator, LysR family [Salibacterium halotolerans]